MLFTGSPVTPDAKTLVEVEGGLSRIVHVVNLGRGQFKGQNRVQCLHAN